MKMKPYLKGGLPISRLGFGAWPLGNTAHEKTMSEEEGIALVKKALLSGINFFDTAPNYALGRSEIILGKALKGIRDQVVINSKFGHHADGIVDFSADKIESSILSSLERLQTTYLDSVLLHNPSMDILQGKTEHFERLDELKQRGLIRAYGASIDTPEEIEAALKVGKIEVIELLYNVFFQSTRSLLDKIKEQGIALIIKVPLDSGWLTGKFSKESKFTGVRSRWTESDIKRRHQMVEEIKKQIGDNDLLSCALGFLWSYDAITTVIPGVRTMQQLEEHLAASQFKFPKHLTEALEDLYDLQIKDYPIPW